jgi:hypothetical protein
MTAQPGVLFPTPLTEVGFPRTSYHLTLGQLQFFDENGYLILRQLITGELLASLQAAGDGWIQQGLALTSQHEDYRFKEEDGKSIFFRVDYLHDKGFPASLELLGSPQILAVAESMCGVNFVPTYEAMVFKQEGEGIAIHWHQDAIHPRRWRIFNLDLYLDSSRKAPAPCSSFRERSRPARLSAISSPATGGITRVRSKSKCSQETCCCTT